MKKLFVGLLMMICFTQYANALSTPTGFIISAPATAGQNPLTTVRLRFAALDSINKANADSVHIRVKADSTVVFYFAYDPSLMTAAKDTILSGLSPNTQYIWAVSVDSADVRVLSTPDTMTTTWIGIESPSRGSNLLTFLDDPMRLATSIVPSIMSSPMSGVSTAFDTTTITLTGTGDAESTMVYQPWKYNRIRLISAVDSSSFTALLYAGDGDSTNGWNFELRDSLNVTTTGTHIFSPRIPVDSHFYLKLRKDAGGKVVLPLKAYLSRDRH